MKVGKEGSHTVYYDLKAYKGMDRIEQNIMQKNRIEFIYIKLILHRPKPRM
jgi:hypothetical protein